MDGRQKLARIPERDARGEGEHVDEQKEYGGSPTRRWESSYRDRPGKGCRLEINPAACELPVHSRLTSSIKSFPTPVRRYYVRDHSCLSSASSQKKVFQSRAMAASHIGAACRIALGCFHVPRHRALSRNSRCRPSGFPALLSLGIHGRSACRIGVANRKVSASLQLGHRTRAGNFLAHPARHPPALAQPRPSSNRAATATRF